MALWPPRLSWMTCPRDSTPQATNFRWICLPRSSVLYIVWMVNDQLYLTFRHLWNMKWLYLCKNTIWLHIGAASGEGKKWVTIQRWAGSGLQEHIFKFRMSKCSDWPQTKKHHFWWFGSYNSHGCKSNDIYTPLGFTRVWSVLCILSQDGRSKQIKWTLGAAKLPFWEDTSWRSSMDWHGRKRRCRACSCWISEHCRLTYMRCSFDIKHSRIVYCIWFTLLQLPCLPWRLDHWGWWMTL